MEMKPIFGVFRNGVKEFRCPENGGFILQMDGLRTSWEWNPTCGEVSITVGSGGNEGIGSTPIETGGNYGIPFFSFNQETAIAMWNRLEDVMALLKKHGLDDQSVNDARVQLLHENSLDDRSVLHRRWILLKENGIA